MTAPTSQVSKSFSEALDCKTLGFPSEANEKTSALPEPSAKEILYLTGWRLHSLTTAICLCVFLVNMEVTIVSTSLVTITDHFHSFNKTNWIVSSYLVPYTCFLVIWAKVSDIFGRKWPLITAMIMFIVFSGGCGISRSMPALITLRAFQGAGASGGFSLSSVVLFEMVPKAKYPLYGTLVFTTVALATVGGPLLGGAIDISTTWRWIFLLNLPVGIFATILIWSAMPTSFPYRQDQASACPIHERDGLSTSLKKFDYIGVSLFLAASLLLVTALLEVSTAFSWSSAVSISILVISALLWVSFFAWERTLSQTKRVQEPVFPWRFLRNRVWMGLLLLSFLNGIPATVITIDLPQRYQAVNGVSPFEAGLRLLPFTLGLPIGSFIANLLAALTKTPTIVYYFVGSVLQLVGLSLMSSVSSSGLVPRSEYAYQAIAALGIGLTFSMLVLATPHAVDSRDLAVATGAIVQSRMLGATIGIAIVTSILNSSLVSELSPALSPVQLNALLQSISAAKTFPASLQAAIAEVVGHAYGLHTRVLVGLASAQLLAIFLVWQRPQLNTSH